MKRGKKKMLKQGWVLKTEDFSEFSELWISWLMWCCLLANYTALICFRLTVSFCWATRRRPHKNQIVELEDEREKKRKAEEDANAAADSAELKKKKEEYEAEKKTWDDEKAELKTKIKAVEESYQSG